MPIGRPRSELVLSEEERIQLTSLAGSRSLPHALVARAKVVLWSADGVSNSEIAAPIAIGPMRPSGSGGDGSSIDV